MAEKTKPATHSKAHDWRYYYEHPSYDKLQRWYRIADEYLANGFDGAAAYHKEYPKSNPYTAKQEFIKIRAYCPQFRTYVAEGKKIMYEAQEIDIERIQGMLLDLAIDENTKPGEKIAALGKIQQGLLEIQKMSKSDKQQSADITINLVD